MNNKVNNNSNINNNLNHNLDKNNQSSERLISSPEQVVTRDNPNEKAQTKKKKKKFKSLISEIISGHKKDELTEKEEHLEKIKKSLGGGNFKKVDKI